MDHEIIWFENATVMQTIYMFIAGLSQFGGGATALWKHGPR